MKVTLSTRSRADLAGIGEYIARENPARAASFVDELIDACEAVALVPLGAPLISGRGPPGLRRKVYQRYLIVYRVHRDTVEIVRILHGARDVARMRLDE